MRLHNRLVKADLWLSTDIIAAVGDPLGLMLYQGMWHIADDSGCLPEDPLQWRMMLFGAFESVSAQRLAELGEKLVELGKVIRYEVDGKPYLWLRNFHAHQGLDYPSEPEYPLPDWILWQPGETRGESCFVIVADKCPVPLKTQARRGFVVVKSLASDTAPEDGHSGDNDVSLTRQRQDNDASLKSSSRLKVLGSSSTSREKKTSATPRARAQSITDLPADASEQEREQLNILKRCKSADGYAYPLDYAKDLDTLRGLAVDFPQADITAELKKFREWLKDHRVGKNCNWRLRLRNWMANTKRFAEPRASPPPKRRVVHLLH